MEKTMTRSSLLRKRFFKDEAPEIVPVKIKGQGAFGMVFEAIDPKLKKRVAVKRMRKSDFKASRELLILEQLCKSKGCVQMLDAFYTVNKKKQLTQNVVMEYIDDSLENFINSHKKRGMYIPVEILKNLMKQLLEGLKGVHSKDICHRDLKPDNILINKKEEVKICDFGCSKTLVPDSKRNNIPHIVSRYYRAPELILCHVKYSVKVDLWALGCIFIELFTRNPLFPGATEGLQFLEQIAVLGTPSMREKKLLYKNLKEENKRLLKKLQYFEPIDLKNLFPSVYKKKDIAEAADLLKHLLAWDPQQRYSAEQALKHRFFSNV